MQAAHGHVRGLISARHEVAAVVHTGSDPPPGPNRDGASAAAAESQCALSLQFKPAISIVRDHPLTDAVAHS